MTASSPRTVEVKPLLVGGKSHKSTPSSVIADRRKCSIILIITIAIIFFFSLGGNQKDPGNHELHQTIHNNGSSGSSSSSNTGSTASSSLRSGDNDKTPATLVGKIDDETDDTDDENDYDFTDDSTETDDRTAIRGDDDEEEEDMDAMEDDMIADNNDIDDDHNNEDERDDDDEIADENEDEIDQIDDEMDQTEDEIDETEDESDFGDEQDDMNADEMDNDENEDETDSTSISSSSSIENINEYATTLLQNLNQAYEKLNITLKEDYGIYYENIYYDDSGYNRGKYLFESGNTESTLSRQRLQRKITMKVLEAIKSKNKDENEDKNVQFVWATGGHSATAGHGNFYDESYTAYLERSAKIIFDSVHINFIGLNYAMGGTSSGPEIAYCEEEIFGTNIDVLVWDFAMTDGKAFWKESLFHRRAGYNPGRPIHIAFHTGGSTHRGRVNCVQELEEIGLAALISSEAIMDAAINSYPDSFGISDEQIQQLPPFVRNFRCDRQIENGDPYCKTDKFNLTMCENRKYRTSWHPGWKWQALMGNLATFYLMEVLRDALTDLSTTTASDITTKIKQLKDEEDADYKKFFSSTLPDYFTDIIPESERSKVDVNILINGHTFCHTGRLPAEIRHKGILTESSQTGFFDYDKGVGLNVASSIPNTAEYMLLVYSEDERQDCPIPTNMDYKDYFYLKKADSWKKLILPNDAEMKEYGNGDIQGMIAICFTLCPWGKCPNGVLKFEQYGAFPNGFFQFEINGITVTNTTEVSDCNLLYHDNGYIFHPNDNGRFEIRAKIEDNAPDNAYLRIGTIVIW